MLYTFVSARHPDIGPGASVFRSKPLAEHKRDEYAAAHCDLNHDLVVVEIERCPYCAVATPDHLDIGCGQDCDNGYHIVGDIPPAPKSAALTLIDDLLALTSKRERFTSDEVQTALLDIRLAL